MQPTFEIDSPIWHSLKGTEKSWRITYPSQHHLPGPPVPRRRDKNRNRLHEGYAHIHPIVDDMPIANTPLKRVVDQIAKHNPATAAIIEHEYDHKLLPMLRRVNRVKNDEEAAMASRNAAIAARNSTVDAAIRSAIEVETTRKDAANRDIANVEAELATAQKRSAVTVSAAKGHYNPFLMPVSENVGLVVDPRAIASRTGTPALGTLKSILLNPWISWAATFSQGAVIGISVGLMAASIYLDSLFRSPPTLALWLVIGIAAALFTKQAIKLSHWRVAEVCYLPTRWAQRFATILTAIAVDCAVLAIDSTVEQQGLLAARSVVDATSALTGHNATTTGADSHIIYFMAAILVTIGFVINSAWEGYYTGRTEILVNRVQANTPEKTPHGIDIESNSAIEALQSVSQEAILKRRLLVLKGELTISTKNTVDQVAALEKQRQTMETSLPRESLERIQDTMDDLQGAQAIFDFLLASALADLPGGGSSFAVRNASTARLRPGRRSRSLLPIWLRDSAQNNVAT